MSYCILAESDLQLSDEHIKSRIQDARRAWTRLGFEGRRSGFVILAVSPKIARAKPNDTMKRLAQRLCFLYLGDDRLDEILLDEIFLEVPFYSHATWKWPTGVNYFSAQGDGRWWQDHRIPGGFGFSTNSIGHMVKSGKLAVAVERMREILDAPDEELVNSPVASKEKALALAMHTIAKASNAVSGRATELLPLPEDRGTLAVAECPVELPPFLEDKNFCEYRGFYHTDHTLPSTYFVEFVERQATVEPYQLDFTYLFRQSIDNPDHEILMNGTPIRTSQAIADAASRPLGTSAERKRLKAAGELDYLMANPRLVEALEDAPGTELTQR